MDREWSRGPVVEWGATQSIAKSRLGLRPASLLQCRDPTQIAVPPRAFNASRFADLCSTPWASAFCSRARPAQTLVIVVGAVMGFAALAGAVQNWLLIQVNRAERLTLIAADRQAGRWASRGWSPMAGLVLIVAVVPMQKPRSI